MARMTAPAMAALSCRKRWRNSSQEERARAATTVSPAVGFELFLESWLAHVALPPSAVA